MSNETTQGINDSNSFEPLSLEKLKEALEGLKSFQMEPIKCFYVDYKTYYEVLKVFFNQPYTPIMMISGIELIVDPDILPGVIIYCETGLYDIWKMLKASPWVDQNGKKLDLWKAAGSIFEGVKRQKEKRRRSLYEDPEFNIRGREWPIYNPFKPKK